MLPSPVPPDAGRIPVSLTELQSELRVRAVTELLNRNPLFKSVKSSQGII